MVTSGLIFGIVSFILMLGCSILIDPCCVPCLGLVFGLAAGYMAGVFNKPLSTKDSVGKSAWARGIAGGLGFLGGFFGNVIFGVRLHLSAMEVYYESFGVSIDPTKVMAVQVVGGLCVGLFDIAWMIILGVAGGGLWYQISGKNQTMTILPPQGLIPPAI